MLFLKKINLEFPTSIDIGEQLYEIDVVFSKKKNSSVSVKRNCLSFRLSSYLSNRNALSHFDELLGKITKKIEKSPTKIEMKTSFKTFFENGQFIFNGEVYRFEKVISRGVKLNGNVFYVNVSLSADVVEKYVVKLLIHKYFLIMETHMQNLNSQTYDFNVKSFSLKCLNSKWGHCSHDDKIMLNLRLFNADIDILNYVIFHELCHIKYKNHSQKFWNEVAKFCPNYKVLRAKLRKAPPEVFM